MHLVHDHAAEGQVRFLQAAPEVDAFVDRLALRGGHQQERRVAMGEQLLHALRALAEALRHVAEALEELGQVLQQVDAGDALERREQHATGAPEHLYTKPSRFEEELQRAPLDEARHALRGVDEVERVARGRRVEHEQVVARLLVQLVQLLHRHVLLRARHRVGDLLVDAVLQDAVARLLVGRVALHEIVEGALRVEHHRPQLALHLDPVGGEALRVDEPFLVAQLRQPQRVCEPLGGVDREHGDLQPLRGHSHRDRRRRRRLADAAGACADADLAALE